MINASQKTVQTIFKNTLTCFFLQSYLILPPIYFATQIVLLCSILSYNCFFYCVLAFMQKFALFYFSVITALLHEQTAFRKQLIRQIQQSALF